MAEFTFITTNDARRLIVVDPEDREQAEQLLTMWLAGEDDKPTQHGINAMQAVLRSLLPAPKPVEPTGLGAVVEDASGERWVLIPGELGGRHSWICSHSSGRWASVEAVRVLSEGVPS